MLTAVSELRMTIPDETLLALKLAPDAASAELRLAAAVKLYELGRLSSGAAAQLAGVPKPVFLAKLAEYGVPTFRATELELAHDVENA
jgi:predicted HTH domain antitoxin